MWPYIIKTKESTLQYVKIAREKVERLKKLRLKLQKKLLEKISPTKDIIGLGPNIVKVEPTVRDGILSGPQSAGKLLGLPKPPFPFNPDNLLTTIERQNAMQAIWNFKLEVKNLAIKKKSSTNKSKLEVQSIELEKELSSSDDDDNSTSSDKVRD